MNGTANDLLLFARVVDEGSFSRAAERLGLPKSTVSRRVAALEAHLGERLLLRTTRRLTITEFGEAVLAHAHHLAEDVEAAEALAQSRQTEPAGRLRVSMPGDLANLALAPVLAAFAQRYPKVALDLDLSARFVDLVAEGFDVALRPGALRDDATLAARRVATFSNALYAAPAYLAQHGTPAEPAALMEHQGLRVRSRDGEPMPWRLQRDGAHWEGVPPGRATANSPELLLRMALSGAGIAIVSEHFALRYLETGALVRVLPDWTVMPVDLWAVFPGRRLMPAKTRVFLDAVVEHFSGPECRVLEAQAARARR
jgi:DNA-binding transcriptional LysR family regulator